MPWPSGPFTGQCLGGVNVVIQIGHTYVAISYPTKAWKSMESGASSNVPSQGHVSPLQQGSRVDDADIELPSALGWKEFPSTRPASLGRMELPSRQPSGRCCAQPAGSSLLKPSDCDVCAEHDKWLCNDEELVNVVLCVAMEWRGLVLASSCP
mmetsp:Transcript_25809/g.50537  ORF Transcript_25809/g.50537 Transcript_25809/m.50537 type:complete len:153 (+) Transcript_25809:2-460(+)